MPDNEKNCGRIDDHDPHEWWGWQETWLTPKKVLYYCKARDMVTEGAQRR
jgi:hypothetical protein